MRKRAKIEFQSESEKLEYLAAVEKGLAEAEAGLSISYEKVRRWLLSWGTDEELPPPE